MQEKNLIHNPFHGLDSHSAIQQIEHACNQFNLSSQSERHQAEKLLMCFKDSPSAIQYSMDILQHSNVPFAQFHAVSTLRECSLKKWALMNVAEKRSLHTFCMDLVVSRFHAYENFVLAQIFRTIAVIYKRQWADLTSEDQEGLFLQIRQMIGLDNKHKLVGMKLCLALIDEFSATTSTAMNLPLEFHTQARKTLQAHGLKYIAQLSFHLLNELIHSTTALKKEGNEIIPQDLQALLTSTLDVCVGILNWDFSGKNDLSWQGSSQASNSSLITPDKTWTDIFIRQDTIHAAFNLYDCIRHFSEASSISHLARQLLIQLSSLSGPTFSDSQQKIGFLGEVFRGALHVLGHPLLDSLGDPLHASFDKMNAACSEILDMCQLIYRIVCNLRMALLVESGSISLIVEEVSSLSCRLLSMAEQTVASAMQCNNPCDDLWQLKAFDSLLETWVLLTTDPLIDRAFSRQPDAQSLQIVALLQEKSAGVFQQYLKTRLAVASFEVLEEDEEDDEVDTLSDLSEQVALVAFLARIDAGQNLRTLSQIFHDLTSRLQQTLNLNKGTAMTVPLSQLMEQLHFILSMISATLADEYTGERPSIPAPIHKVSFDSTSNDDIVVQLIQQILSLLEFESQRLAVNPDAENLSPYLSERLFWSLTRITTVYLAPDPELHDEGIAPSIVQAFDLPDGPQSPNGGASVVDFLVQKVSLYLSLWPTQPKLTEYLCELIKVLSKTRAATCSIGLPSWAELVRANSSAGSIISALQKSPNGLHAICRLPANLRGILMEGICRMGMASHDSLLRSQHFEEVARPVEHRLQRIVGTPKFGSVHFVNDVSIQEELKLLIELYSGIAEATEMSSHATISQFCIPSLPIMVKLMDVFHGNTQIVLLILQFFCKLVESLIAYLSPQEAHGVYLACGELIRTYSKHNLGLVTASASKVEEEDARDVFALLELLSHLIAKDFIDFSDADSTQDVIDSATVVVCDVVFFGLSRVIPMMKKQLLDLPRVCMQYFALISFLVEVYSEKLALIDTQLFLSLVQSLDFGIQHVQFDIAKYSLLALSELVSFHYKAIQRGQHGLNQHLQQHPNIFAGFIQTIFKVLLWDNYRAEYVEASSAALFSLILCEKDRFYEIAQGISESQPDQETKERLLASLGQLAGQMFQQGSVSLDRVSRNKFKTHLKQFVSETRGFVQYK